MVTTFRTAFVPLLCAAPVACGGDSSFAPGTHSVADSAGIRIVESFSPSWGEDGPRIDPEPFLRIGRQEEGPYQFGLVFRALLLANGQIAVEEASAREVRIFDSAGRHVRTFGGHGEGPGEFQTLGGLFAYRGDSLAAVDPVLLRTTIFPISPGSHRSIRNQVKGFLVGFGCLRDGPCLLHNPGEIRRGQPPGLQWDSSAIVAMDPSDGSTRVVARLPSREKLVGPDGDEELLLPAAGAIQAVAADGFHWARTDRSEIRFYDGAGSLRRILRRAVQPRSVTPTMIREHVEAALAAIRQSGARSVPQERRRFEEATPADHLPFYQAAFVDRDQRLWASEWSWPHGPPSRRWSVFSLEGVWLGDVEAPEGLGIVDVRRDIVLGISRDEHDVPYVHLHRLIWR
jgi:hypothetical protein